MTKRRVIITVWLTLTAAGIVWAIVGDLPTFNRMLLILFIGVSLSFGVARLIALRRIAREEIVVPHMVPFRVSAIICGAVMWGPVIGVACGFNIHYLVVAISFAGGFCLLLIVAALFSDGYQGLWGDSLVFFGRLAPPEDDWLLVRDAKREAGQQKWSEGSGGNS